MPNSLGLSPAPFILFSSWRWRYMYQRFVLIHTELDDTHVRNVYRLLHRMCVSSSVHELSDHYGPTWTYASCDSRRMVTAQGENSMIIVIRLAYTVLQPAQLQPSRPLTASISHVSMSSATATAFTGLAFLLVCFSRDAAGESILMNALMGEGSHFFGMAAIGEALVGRSHDVTMLISNAYQQRAEDERFSRLFSFEIFNHSIPPEEIRESFEAANRNAFSSSVSQTLSLMKLIGERRGLDCDTVLSNEELFDRFRSRNFSILVYDAVWPCGPLIATKLSIPYVVNLMFPSPATYGRIYLRDEAFNAAYTPEAFSGLSNKMTFGQRVSNVVQSLMMNTVSGMMGTPYENLNKKHGISSDSLNVLYSKAELYLINTDFATEFPCALNPNMILVGGLTTRPGQPLDGELEEFVRSAGEDGVVICSTGTYFTDVPDSVVNAFADAFGRLPQKVIWQLTARLDNPPKNVRILPWIPQNDLLAHPQTKVLLYHGGNNGFFEAIYHAVPIITFPILADQYDVGARVVAHGIGRKVDKNCITADVLYHALHDVLNNVSYHDAMQRVSAIFKDRPEPPAERAAFWVEHAMKHGEHHLRPASRELSFIQRNLIDVYAFFLALVLVLCWFVHFLLRYTWNTCCSSKSQNSKFSEKKKE